MPDEYHSHVTADLDEPRDELLAAAEWLRREADLLTDGRSTLGPIVHFGHHSPCGESHAARHHVAAILDGYWSRLEEYRRDLVTLADNLAQADHLRRVDR